MDLLAVEQGRTWQHVKVTSVKPVEIPTGSLFITFKLFFFIVISYKQLLNLKRQPYLYSDMKQSGAALQK
jgi:hypothetical protein